MSECWETSAWPSEQKISAQHIFCQWSVLFCIITPGRTSLLALITIRSLASLLNYRFSSRSSGLVEKTWETLGHAGSGMPGEIYISGVPTKTQNCPPVDRQRGARRFIVASLLRIPSPLCVRISRYLLSTSSSIVERQRQRGYGKSVEFSSHCELLQHRTPPLRWKFSWCK